MKVTFVKCLLGLVLGVSLLNSSAQAETFTGFTGLFAPENWTSNAPWSIDATTLTISGVYSDGTDVVGTVNNTSDLSSVESVSFTYSSTLAYGYWSQWVFTSADVTVNGLTSTTPLSPVSGDSSQSAPITLTINASGFAAFLAFSIGSSNYVHDEFESGEPDITITNFSYTTQAVPEPSSIALLGLAAIGSYLVRRKKA